MLDGIGRRREQTVVDAVEVIEPMHSVEEDVRGVDGNGRHSKVNFSGMENRHGRGAPCRVARYPYMRQC